MAKAMIFHYTLPFFSQTSGSYVHVANMLDGFREIGYEVATVSGYGNERRAAVESVKAEAFQGRKFDFVFAWSSTSPSLLPPCNLLYPWLDPLFFEWCKNQTIPVGLFYGDVHWRFDFYRRHVPAYKRVMLWPLYWFDWLTYRHWVDHLFLPSMRMKTALPTFWPEDRLSPLFPGCKPRPQLVSPGIRSEAGKLELFYVGSVVPPLYDLKPMLEGIGVTESVRLTLCCRESEWAKFRSYYEPLDSAKIQIVHAYGEALRVHYEKADLFGLFWRGHPYLDFAMPVKIFEAMGYGVPVVTTAGTEIARFVAQEKIGWVVTTQEEFVALLTHLATNPQEIAVKRRHVEAVRERHTWLARAQQVADTLTRIG